MSGCREVVVTMVTRVNIWTLAIALLTSVMIPVFLYSRQVAGRQLIDTSYDIPQCIM